jgi:phospholipase D1/2
VPGRNAWRQPRAESAGLLVDAKDYYTAFYRAALGARRYILLSGWQFDRGVQLLREKDVAYARSRGGEVRLLPMLDGLCRSRPQLEVYVLAWDFHVVFALEREWMQKLYFHWATHERLRFRFDDCHPPGGCHHQKFVVIDGRISFLGGIDLCESRWDDRRHLARNPARVSRGTPQKPYHDVQTYLTGRPVAEALTALFRERWKRAGGDPIRLPEVPARTSPRAYRPRGALPLPPGPVALSRTDPRKTLRQSSFEVRVQLEDAIAAAQRLIYIETQYFSSRRLCESLERRLRQRKPRLQVVMVLNQRAEAVKEEIAVGLRQAQNMERLRQVAAETGHALGAYYSVAEGRVREGRGPAREKPTYIHSKLMIVDDRYLNVGSANLTNRSMDLDTELNASWECQPGQNPALVRTIRRARVSLLAEHLGVKGVASLRALAAVGDLVAHLDGLLARGRGRLRALPPPSPQQARALSIIDPRALPFDPESELDPEVAEATQQRSLFRVGIRDLWIRLATPAQRRSEEAPAGRLARSPGHMSDAQKR